MTEKIKKEKINFVILLLIGIFLISFASSAYINSKTQYFAPGTANSFNYNRYGTDIPFSHFDEGMCQAGQDFIIQVAPFGCEPAVVRSDLLEERNVAVLCQLSATKINPLIDVKTIDHISFRGDYPQEVSGIGFHPAQAAIKTSSSTLLNSPVLNNIGYAVIVLRQQRNESAMPDYVEGTLTATLRYDADNAFGVGRTNYYLPELTDEEFSQRINQYEFWDGKGFLRAEGITNDYATISIYEDEFHSTSNFTLQKGETSQRTYVPGFYCMAGVEIRLDEIKNPDTRVKLKINGDVVEVADEEKFFDNKCQVKNIDNKGISQSVSITCLTDFGRKTFDLKTSPKIKLNIDGEEKDYGLGDYLYTASDNSKFVYLSYMGTKGIGNKVDDVYVYLVAISEKRDKLTEGELGDVARMVGNLERKSDTGNPLVNALADIGRSFTGYSEKLMRSIFEGNNYKKISFSKLENLEGRNVKIINFAEPVDSKFSDENLDNAVDDYDSIIEQFSLETLKNDQQTFGEKALFQKIRLADKTGKKRTMISLCEEFEDKYPLSQLKSSLNSLCGDMSRASSSEISSRDVSVDGIIRTISFERVTEPSPDEFSAEIFIEGKMTDKVTLTKNQKFYLVEEGEYIQLTDLTEDSAKVSVYVKPSSDAESLRKVFSTPTKTLQQNVAESFGGGYIFTLGNINLEKVAKVSVIPNVKYETTEANFTFKIGIEKRAIQLSPEKTLEKLDSVTQTINKWEANNEKLGKAVKSLKTACLATGAYFTAKNFLANLDGKGIARQEVMRGSGGWFDICTQAKDDGEYVSVDACLLDKNDDIERDVEQVASIMDKQESITEENVGEKLIEIKNSLNLNSSYVDVSEALSSGGYDDGKVTLTQARDLERLQTILDDFSSSTELKKIAEAEKNKILTNIKTNTQNYALYTSLQKEMESSGINLGVTAYGDKDAINGEYSGGTILASQVPGANLKDKDDDGKIINYPSEVITYNGKKYLVILSGAGSTYIVEKVFEYNGISGNTIQVGNEDKIIPTKFSKFTKYDEGSYNTPIRQEDRVVRFFETDPYKGYPAIVPVDVNKGWYAVTKQTVTGNLRAYDDSGRLVYFYMCNVGQDGRPDGYERGDTCVGFNVAGQFYGTFPGLDESKTKTLIDNGIRAVNEAQVAYQQGRTKAGDKINILGQSIGIGNPAADVPGMQCQDFMSAKECYAMFNVCDPVICPTSRCDLGGTYPVKDVVQSGIIGSVALCAPNYQEGIYVPVCLTGVNAGIDSLLSVYKNYQSCLQHSLETGEQVGICDQIHSIYMCDFFWRQAVPFTKLLIPNLLSKVSGEGQRGGGEYLDVLGAYSVAGKSVDYMVQYYGANSYEAFNARSTEEVGTEVCKNFPSLVHSASGDFIDALTEPDSPPQYSAWFQEIPYTTATVPPISQYKVFYHIYAGKDRGAYYNVYLKSPSGTSFYYDNPTVTVATSYIAKGDFDSDTLDFTAPAGYKELCVNVNGQDECGFTQVSTDFALNYLSDKYVADQVANTRVSTEKECISGSASLSALNPFLNPNLQAGAEQAINPQLLNEGIVRICSSNSPGQGTDVNWDNENSRWRDVGYCGDEKLRCWLDTNSVKKILANTSLLDDALGDVEDKTIEQLRSIGNYIDINEEKNEIEKLNTLEKIGYITDELINRAVFNNEKAYLLLWRGNASAELAERAYEDWVEKNKPEGGDDGAGTSGTTDGKTTEEKRDVLKEGGIVTDDLTDEEVDLWYKLFYGEEIKETVSPIFEFDDGNTFGGQDIYYSYRTDGWYWSVDNSKWYSLELASLATGAITGQEATRAAVLPKLSDKNREFTLTLDGQSYQDGLILLMKRVIVNDEGAWAKTFSFGARGNAELITDKVRYSSGGIFSVKQTRVMDIYLKYENGWNIALYPGPENYVRVSNMGSSVSRALSKEILDLTLQLSGKDSSQGAVIIFGYNLGEKGTGVLEDRKDVNYNFNNQRNQAQVIRAIQETNSVSGNCQQYVNLLYKDGEFIYKNSVPDPLLLVSLMQQESTCNKNAQSDSSVGLMQINCQAHKGKYGLPSEEFACKQELLINPEKNIEVGAQILRASYDANKNGLVFQGCSDKNVKYYGWEAAVRGYNGWGCGVDSSGNKITKQDNYVEEVMGRYNQLISVS
ncbi:MAG: transglycosylase SLT domain-containing protein [Nanoarchaeota archaeon]|nr:transglycosylase SLT domain-containing protein [Nanoarchaeota archaeon]